MNTIRFLRTFIAIAELGSFAAASEQVAVTHAAVGQQMRALERELRCTLFDRSQRSISLTPDARALIPRARKLLADYESLVNSSREQPTIAGAITIGGIVSAMGLLANCLIDLKTLYPALDIKLVNGHTTTLPLRVQAGELDAALYVERRGRPSLGMQWTRLYEEPFVLLAHASVGTDASEALNLLRTEPFIRFDRTGSSGAKIERLLRRYSIQPYEILELNSLSAIAELVRQKTGVALVPLLNNYDWDNDPSLKVFRLPSVSPVRYVGMLENGGRAHITRIMRDHLMEMLAA